MKSNPNAAHEIACAQPQISADKRTLSFALDWRGENATCVVPRSCLEFFFWLPPNADDVQLRKVFDEGFSRIEALARRKLLVRPVRPVRLTEADFRVVDRLPSLRRERLLIAEFAHIQRRLGREIDVLAGI